MCPSCEGKRLRPEMLSVKIDGNSIIDITQFSIHECFEFSKVISF